MRRRFGIYMAMIGLSSAFIFFSRPAQEVAGSALSHAYGDQKNQAGQPSLSKQTNTSDPRKFFSEMADLIAKMAQKLQRTPSMGNIDRDFANLITAHNQSAIDMAELELKYGKDPEMQHMARKIIEGQKADIKVIQDWVKEHGSPHPHIEGQK